MPVKEDAPLDELAIVIQSLLELRHRSKAVPGMDEWCKYLIYGSLRKAEEFTDPVFSVAALRQATLDPLLDLKNRRRPKWLGPLEKVPDDFKGKRRRAFQWEHVRPLGMSAQVLYDLEPPFATAAIVAELKRLEIAWVTRAEDRRLDQEGFRATRPDDVWAAYRKLCIAIEGREAETRNCGQKEQCADCRWLTE